MWITNERKNVRKTLKPTRLDMAIQRAKSEFFAIKANLISDKRILNPAL